MRNKTKEKKKSHQKSPLTTSHGGWGSILCRAPHGTFDNVSYRQTSDEIQAYQAHHCSRPSFFASFETDMTFAVDWALKAKYLFIFLASFETYRQTSHHTQHTLHSSCLSFFTSFEMIFLERTRKGHRQSDQHWNCFKRQHWGNS